MNSHTKRILLASCSLLLMTSIYASMFNAPKTYALAPTPDNTTVSFEPGLPGVLNVTIGSNTIKFLEQPDKEAFGVDPNKGLLKDLQRPFSRTYETDSNLLCTTAKNDPIFNKKKSFLVAEFKADPVTPPPYNVDVNLILTTGDSTDNCKFAEFNHSVGFHKNITFTPSTPISGQGSDFTDPTFAGASFAFEDAATIVGKIKRTHGANSGQIAEIRFVDVNVADNNRQFVTADAPFCPTLGNSGKGKITISRADGGKFVNIEAGGSEMAYYDSTGTCKKYSTMNKFSVLNEKPPVYKIARRILQWNSPNIVNVHPEAINLHPVKLTGDQVSLDRFLENDDCKSGYGFKLDPGHNDVGTYVEFGDGAADGQEPFPACNKKFKRTALVLGDRDQTLINPGDPCESGAGCDNGVCTDPAEGCVPATDDDDSTGNGNNEKTCESNGFLKLEWLLCPVLRGIDYAVTAFYDEVNDQLCIKTQNTGTQTDVDNGTAQSTCKSKNKDILETKGNGASAHDAWSAMRVIATSLLVIVMLAAIVGQAFGGKA